MPSLECRSHKAMKIHVQVYWCNFLINIKNINLESLSVLGLRPLASAGWSFHHYLLNLFPQLLSGILVFSTDYPA